MGSLSDGKQHGTKKTTHCTSNKFRLCSVYYFDESDDRLQQLSIRLRCNLLLLSRNSNSRVFVTFLLQNSTHECHSGFSHLQSLDRSADCCPAPEATPTGTMLCQVPSYHARSWRSGFDIIERRQTVANSVDYSSLCGADCSQRKDARQKAVQQAREGRRAQELRHPTQA